MIIELTKDIFISLIIFIIGALFSKLYNLMWQKIPIRKFWRFENNSQVYIVTTSTPENIRIDEKEFMSLGYTIQYLALGKVELILNKIYPNIDMIIRMDCYFERYYYDQNLIVFGGPIRNECSNEFLNRLNSPFKFDGYTLIDTRTNEKFQSVIENEKIIEDYTLVIKAKNPLDNKKTIIIIAGCRAPGSLIGALFLSKININTFKKLSCDKNLALVLKGDVLDYAKVSNVRIVKQYNF